MKSNRLTFKVNKFRKKTHNISSYRFSRLNKFLFSNKKCLCMAKGIEPLLLFVWLWYIDWFFRAKSLFHWLGALFNWKDNNILNIENVNVESVWFWGFISYQKLKWYHKNRNKQKNEKKLYEQRFSMTNCFANFSWNCFWLIEIHGRLPLLPHMC